MLGMAIRKWWVRLTRESPMDAIVDSAPPGHKWDCAAMECCAPARATGARNIRRAPKCDASIRCYCSFGLSLRDWKVRPIPHLSGAQPNEHPQECPTHVHPSTGNGSRRHRVQVDLRGG